ncbi:hypothetical protein HPB48_022803 [Haemaphysalis longicornis]|uniref:Uncharacterized protein n=1 Tax=Haemaphysalis longicornis TaxID=44386 RepID=A0A9J6GC33_HAELO|nr:hypothetical protein HPB48_022803 [Haemaphysalis longicornis]
MQASATMVNEKVLHHDGPPDSLPFKPTAKPEVIKKGKKVRVIYESQANYMVLKHVFGDIVSLNGIPPRNGASGCPLTRAPHVPFSNAGFMSTIDALGETGLASLTGSRPCMAMSPIR